MQSCLEFILVVVSQPFKTLKSILYIIVTLWTRLWFTTSGKTGLCRVSTFFRTCLSYFHLYLFHSKALNKCKIQICLGVDGVQRFREDDEMIILDYVTNDTTVNPQESQMTSVIMSKRTKGKKGFRISAGR